MAHKKSQGGATHIATRLQTPSDEQGQWLGYERDLEAGVESVKLFAGRCECDNNKQVQEV